MGTDRGEVLEHWRPARGPMLARSRAVVGWRAEMRHSGRRASPRAAGLGRAAGARARRVLLVEDDAVLRLLFRFNLEASGLGVVEAEDGETALRLLEDELPDVVLLDVMMPGIDGWAVAERLRAEERTQRLPVIFVTARAEDEAREQGRELGAAGYLVKPLNPVTLAEQIEELLRGR